MVDEGILKMLADYVLAAVFLALYVRESAAHRATLERVAEQRRVENQEQRTLIYRIARLNSGGALESSTTIPIQD